MVYVSAIDCAVYYLYVNYSEGNMFLRIDLHDGSTEFINTKYIVLAACRYQGDRCVLKVHVDAPEGSVVRKYESPSNLSEIVRVLEQ